MKLSKIAKVLFLCVALLTVGAPIASAAPGQQAPGYGYGYGCGCGYYGNGYNGNWGW